MTLTRTFLAATAAIALSAGTSSALGVSIGGGVNNPPDSVENDFIGPNGNDFLTGLDFLQGNSGGTGGALSFIFSGAPAAKLTFTAVGAESGFENEFDYDDGAKSFTLTDKAGNFGPGIGADPNPNSPMMATVLAGFDFGSSLSFTGNLNGEDGRVTETYGTGHAAFGVFYDDSKNGHLTEFWLALDDQNTQDLNSDDNHDDLVVRVDVAAVPLPAAAWLLLGVSGGLIAAKRRSSVRKAT